MPIRLCVPVAWGSVGAQSFDPDWKHEAELGLVSKEVYFMAKMTDRHKMMAYVLHREFEYRQSAIAQLMGVSQSTIANAVKEISFRLTIQNLEKELQEARRELERQGVFPESPRLYLE